jgi:hypothetical protein
MPPHPRARSRAAHRELVPVGQQLEERAQVTHRHHVPVSLAGLAALDRDVAWRDGCQVAAVKAPVVLLLHAAIAHPHRGPTIAWRHRTMIATRASGCATRLAPRTPQARASAAGRPTRHSLSRRTPGTSARDPRVHACFRPGKAGVRLPRPRSSADRPGRGLAAHAAWTGCVIRRLVRQEGEDRAGAIGLPPGDPDAS